MQSLAPRVLLTGSSGQLGVELASQLVAHGCTVIGFDLAPGPYTSLRHDVRDEGAVRRATAGADVIVHTAALHAPHVGQRSEREFEDINVQGTISVLEAARQCGAQRVVYTSTTSVYGHALVPSKGRAVWVTEDVSPRPRDIYDVTKLAAEAACRDMARQGSLSIASLRVCRFFLQPPAIMASHRFHRGADVRDIAAGHVLALRASLSSPFEVFNIAGPYRVSAAECAELWTDAQTVLERHYPGIAAAFAERGWPLPARIDRVYCSDRAHVSLNYVPRYGINEFLASAGESPL
jgi:UDP-glucose 4-epimerase